MTLEGFISMLIPGWHLAPTRRRAPGRGSAAADAYGTGQIRAGKRFNQACQSFPISIFPGHGLNPERKARPVPVNQAYPRWVFTSRNGPRQGPPTIKPETRRIQNANAQIAFCVLLERSIEPNIFAINNEIDPAASEHHPIATPAQSCCASGISRNTTSRTDLLGPAVGSET